MINQNTLNLPQMSMAELEKSLQKAYDEDPSEFFLVKIGANDGWMCDGLYNFVMKNDPNCVMVEPIPCYFEALKKTFSSLKNVKFENVAIDTVDGEREMTYIPDERFQNVEVTFRLSHQPHLLKEHWARGLGSFYEDKNNLACPELSQHSEKITVKTETISSMLQRHSANKYKNFIFSTDCEGHDYEILKDFNFGDYKPLVYICEIVKYTRYPRSHPRRSGYISEEATPGGRVPPPGTDGWNTRFEIFDPRDIKFIQSLSDLDEEIQFQACTYLCEAERATRSVHCAIEKPEEKEYLQENGLYTVEEFKSTIDIFNKNNYKIFDSSDDGDLFAFKEEDQ